MPEIRTEELAGHAVFVHLGAVGVSPQQADWATLFRVNPLKALACDCARLMLELRA